MARSFTDKIKSNFTWKRGAFLIGALLILYFLIQALMPNPVPADIGTVELGDIEVVVHGQGKTQVRESYVISTPVTGRLKRIVAEPGDEVIAGETVIVTIEPADPNFMDVRTGAQAEARIKAAQAGLELAQAQFDSRVAELDFANQELERTEQLYAEGHVTRRALEQNQRNVRLYQAEVDTARHNVEVSEFNLETARAALNPPEGLEMGEDACCFILKAPVSGRILRLLQESENVIQAGTPIIEIGDLTDMEIIADLLSTDAVKVTRGDFVHIDHWGGSHELEGRVRLVEPSGFTKMSALGVEEQRVNVVVDFFISGKPDSSLGDGFRVEIYVVVDSKNDVQKVPVSALFRVEDQWAVFRLEGNRAVLTPIETGLKNDMFAEVISGLEEGDKIIIHPSNEVGDGVKIRQR